MDSNMDSHNNQGLHDLEYQSNNEQMGLNFNEDDADGDQFDESNLMMAGSIFGNPDNDGGMTATDRDLRDQK